MKTNKNPNIFDFNLMSWKKFLEKFDKLAFLIYRGTKNLPNLISQFWNMTKFEYQILNICYDYFSKKIFWPIKDLFSGLSSLKKHEKKHITNIKYFLIFNNQTSSYFKINVKSRVLTCLVYTFRITCRLFQIAMKGISDPYVLWPFVKKLIS